MQKTLKVQIASYEAPNSLYMVFFFGREPFFFSAVSTNLDTFVVICRSGSTRHSEF